MGATTSIYACKHQLCSLKSGINGIHKNWLILISCFEEAPMYHLLKGKVAKTMSEHKKKRAPHQLAMICWGLRLQLRCIIMNSCCHIYGVFHLAILPAIARLHWKCSILRSIMCPPSGLQKSFPLSF